MNTELHPRNGASDQELVSKVVNGDGASFALIVHRYEDRLYDTAFRLVGSDEDACDILQDTFIKAYENLGAFRGGSSLYTWLFRIAVNTSLSHRRKIKSHRTDPGRHRRGDRLRAGGNGSG